MTWQSQSNFRHHQGITATFSSALPRLRTGRACVRPGPVRTDYDKPCAASLRAICLVAALTMGPRIAHVEGLQAQRDDVPDYKLLDPMPSLGEPMFRTDPSTGKFVVNTPYFNEDEDTGEIKRNWSVVPKPVLPRASSSTIGPDQAALRLLERIEELERRIEELETQR
jgi:hypothetical protein